MIDLIGKRFGKLIVLKWIGKDKWGHSKWLCQCDCGNKIIVLGYGLTSGNTKSCGCLQKEGNSIKHGHNRRGKVTGFYRSWYQMIQRCINPNNKDYHNYGGRGIKVCKRWLKFENFLEDMIEGWRPGLTLERRKNEKGYFKDNCKWVTREEQQRNTRGNHLLTYNGKTQCVAAWSEETGIPRQTIEYRINHGWTAEEALTTPVGQRRKKSK